MVWGIKYLISNSRLSRNCITTLTKIPPELSARLSRATQFLATVLLAAYMLLKLDLPELPDLHLLLDRTMAMVHKRIYDASHGEYACHESEDQPWVRNFYHRCHADIFWKESTNVWLQVYHTPPTIAHMFVRK